MVKKLLDIFSSFWFPIHFECRWIHLMREAGSVKYFVFSALSISIVRYQTSQFSFFFFWILRVGNLKWLRIQQMRAQTLDRILHSNRLICRTFLKFIIILEISQEPCFSLSGFIQNSWKIFIPFAEATDPNTRGLHIKNHQAKLKTIPCNEL